MTPLRASTVRLRERLEYSWNPVRKVAFAHTVALTVGKGAFILLPLVTRALYTKPPTRSWEDLFQESKQRPYYGSVIPFICRLLNCWED